MELKITDVQFFLLIYKISRYDDLKIIEKYT